ncbi:ATP synthase F1 subunit epsilon [Clostridium botulinum]|uniref:ATP synthase F1 subunit epsilon n=1 Tax=Clostridium TaxID=1485 RepID=UPI0005031551|nr:MULTISPECIES: ATP synthase F1 subunit epsilon [unclassified Clostridium]AIY78632.1 ATP synthase F1, epsilon subunit [Clostridium botulinum 202F]KAI3344730.1 ATP synthase F1 subunit epsilon [Clostridium botulinum]KFX54352.1 ATP synthase subunit epsilon [Clostridium botulinum]KFX58509.1 ATP synthase subunit epsilon [Clostridium botulinum]KON13226.1 ATP synthase subunit epsilon [Clostridium botulinum]
MADTFLLKIVTPDKDIFNGNIKRIFLRNSVGRLEILANHANMVTSTISSIVEFTDADGKDRKLFISKGIASIFNNEMTIFSESAEFSDNIDLNRAEKAKERAEKRLLEGNKYDKERAELALVRSIERINLKKMN